MEFFIDNKYFMKRLLPICFILLLISCSKEVKKSDIENVSGTYHWYYSHDNLFENIYSSETSNKHGIQIKSRNKVNFYTNSEKVMSLKINRAYQTQSGGTAIVVQWTEVLERGLIIDGNTLTFFDWPNGDLHNVFQKID